MAKPTTTMAKKYFEDLGQNVPESYMVWGEVFFSWHGLKTNKSNVLITMWLQDVEQSEPFKMENVFG